MMSVDVKRLSDAAPIDTTRCEARGDAAPREALIQPVRNRPSTTAAAAAQTRRSPNGSRIMISGIAAPTAKETKEEKAATQGLVNSWWSMPSSTSA